MGFFTASKATVIAGALTVFQASIAVAAPLLEGATEALTTTSPYFGNASNTTTTTHAPPPVSPATEGALIGVGVVVGIGLIVGALKYCGCLDNICCESTNERETEERQAIVTAEEKKRSDVIDKIEERNQGYKEKYQELHGVTLNIPTTKNRFN